MARKRSLHAIRKWVKDMRADAKKRGDAPMMGATWVFSYTPADDPDNSQEITEEQFFGTADKEEDDLGHPRAGVYEAKAVANPDDEAEIILAGPIEGIWNGDDLEKTEQEKGGIEATLNALAKATRSTVELASAGEARAMRRARQAEERESEVRAKHEDTLAAMDKLRQDLLIAEIARQRAEADKAQAETERDAAKADLDEFQREGGELAPLASAGMTRIYELFCKHMGEPAIATQLEAFDEAIKESAAYLVDTTVTLDDGRVVILALLLHHHFGLPWRSLRVIFFMTWGVDFKEAPPVDWQPPINSDDDDAPAAEEIH